MIIDALAVAFTADAYVSNSGEAPSACSSASQQRDAVSNRVSPPSPFNLFRYKTVLTASTDRDESFAANPGSFRAKPEGRRTSRSRPAVTPATSSKMRWEGFDRASKPVLDSVINSQRNSSAGAVIVTSVRTVCVNTDTNARERVWDGPGPEPA